MAWHGMAWHGMAWHQQQQQQQQHQASKQAGRQASMQGSTRASTLRKRFLGREAGEKRARGGREGGPSLLEEKPFEALTRHRRGWPAPEHHAAPDPVLVQKKKWRVVSRCEKFNARPVQSSVAIGNAGRTSATSAPKLFLHTPRSVEHSPPPER